MQTTAREVVGKIAFFLLVSPLPIIPRQLRQSNSGLSLLQLIPEETQTTIEVRI